MNRNFALGRLKTGQLNKTEQAYADYLSQLQAVGGILWHKFEGMKFRLADNTFYTPDFIVMQPGGQLEAHEVKGFWQEDARVKIKVASSIFPLKFIAVRPRPKSKGGGWDMEEF
ncbi:DUF1064 domain-containing protein [Bordetella genomosp. 9]|uniref:DUF1064 domain-containing protein n=1 Tax=Bordetella genomosp. 9 TaxID=1416803 RepID=A0A261RPU6_9BORD|nr:DUF1064 domain-containing protein [Bordetella genomosp. 9]OZI26702.1 DUF1064 domain-containing protein [Bordetella genomosp. 9]